MAGLLQSASRQMATNASNTCGDPFYARVRQHVRAEHGLSRQEAWQVRCWLSVSHDSKSVDDHLIG